MKKGEKKQTIFFDLKLLAKEVEDKRWEKRLSYTSAAKEIGISTSSIERIVRHTSVPELNTYYLLCKWLNVSMDYYTIKEKKGWKESYFLKK
jgi:transcriptional regulator with XRE-family HTH domain